jgi:XRE family transcriptional regulator, regulator of sulfur utilization
MPYKCRNPEPVSFPIFVLMEPVSVADKMVAARKAKGFSQAKLAELAQVNLRTIQRIEKGETLPRGYTLQSIARALDHPIDHFTVVVTGNLPGEVIRLLQVLNLSTLAYLVCPFGNIIVPILVWRNKKEDIRAAGAIAARIINFQVLWTVVMSVALVLTVFVQLFMKYYFGVVPAFALLGVFLFMYLLNLVYILYYAAQLRKGSLNIYPIGIHVF